VLQCGDELEGVKRNTLISTIDYIKGLIHSVVMVTCLAEDCRVLISLSVANVVVRRPWINELEVFVDIWISKI